MRTRLWTARFTALVVLAGALDVLTTDLRYESNPVLVGFGKSLRNLLLLKGSLSVC
jgi:hypothetical protein